MPEDFDFLGEAINASAGAVAAYDTSALQDPWAFIFEHSRTLDPDATVDAVRPFPNHEYLRVLLKEFLSQRMVVIAKSRQLMVSWICCAYALWKAMSRRGSIVFLVSKKEADAGFDNPLSLLERCWFIYQHLPDHMKIPCERRLKPPMLSFPGQYSSITGLPQDADALRMYTATLIFCDEWAFQEKAAASFAAMRPTINKNGQILGVSTSNGKRNLFARVVNDQEKDQ